MLNPLVPHGLMTRHAHSAPDRASSPCWLDDLDAPAVVAHLQSGALAAIAWNNAFATLVAPRNLHVGASLVHGLGLPALGAPGTRAHTLQRRDGQTSFLTFTSCPILRDGGSVLVMATSRPLALVPTGVSADVPESMRTLARLVEQAGSGAPLLLTGEPHTGKTEHALAVSGPDPTVLSGQRAHPDALTAALGSGRTVIITRIDEAPLAVQDVLVTHLQRADLSLRFTATGDLADFVRNGTVRACLAGPLAANTVPISALRERAHDLPLLAVQRARYLAGPTDTPVVLSDASVERIVAHPWLGNLAELDATLTRAIALSTGSTLEVRPRRTQRHDATPIAPLQQAIRQHILRALDRTGWRVEGASGAAKMLGLAPSTLRSKMRKYHIRRA